MHLIIAFAALFWRSENARAWVLIPPDQTAWIWISVLAQPVFLALGAGACSIHLHRRTARRPDSIVYAIEFHHRATSILRGLMTAGFLFSVLLTPWPAPLVFEAANPWLRTLGDVVTLAPFFLGCLVLWLISFPLERRFRRWGSDATDPGVTPGWDLRSYLDFNVRHHLLVVAVPMMLVLLGSNLAQAYERELRSMTGWALAPEGFLAIFAGGLFVAAPVLLRRIWRTSPLPSGPLRDRLEALGRRIGLRFREILVWRSDGIMMNAAVMGILPGVRYVLLSDALLATMSPTQIEAVFGHEAGHIRHRHIQHFLVFAMVGWMVVAGLMEGLAWLSNSTGRSWGLSFPAVEAFGAFVTVVFWGVGFGWVSRRFERQADLFGARCVTPSGPECDYPCSVHLGSASKEPGPERVCATGAETFACALHRVAILNGIPSEERSWRHSSIASRIRFLHAVAADPALAVRFERTVRRIKATLLTAAALGITCATVYWTTVGQLALVRLQAGVP